MKTINYGDLIMETYYYGDLIQRPHIIYLCIYTLSGDLIGYKDIYIKVFTK